MIDIIKNFSFPEEYNFSTNNEMLRSAIYDAWGKKCGYTGKAITFESMCIDHVIPRKYNGPDNIFNYVPTTIEINSSKSAQFDEEAIIGMLSLIRLVYAPKVIEKLEKPQIDKSLSFLFNDGLIKILTILFQDIHKEYSLRSLLSQAKISIGGGCRIINQGCDTGLFQDIYKGNQRKIKLNNEYVFFNELQSMFNKS